MTEPLKCNAASLCEARGERAQCYFEGAWCKLANNDVKTSFAAGKLTGLDDAETFAMFQAMSDYYAGPVIVRHWLQETMDSGRWVTTAPISRNIAMRCINGGFYEQPTIEAAE
jgi:hypothetical protein